MIISLILMSFAIELVLPEQILFTNQRPIRHLKIADPIAPQRGLLNVSPASKGRIKVQFYGHNPIWTKPPAQRMSGKSKCGTLLGVAVFSRPHANSSVKPLRNSYLSIRHVLGAGSGCVIRRWSRTLPSVPGPIPCRHFPAHRGDPATLQH